MANRYFFIHPGRLLKIDQSSFQSRLVNALFEIQAVSAVRFIRATRPRGIQFATVGFDEMYRLSRRSDGKAPLGLQIGNHVYFLNDRDRFGTPGQRFIEGVTIHEVLHVFGLRHSPDVTSIMNENLTAVRMNANDIRNVQKRVGKPR